MMVEAEISQSVGCQLFGTFVRCLLVEGIIWYYAADIINGRRGGQQHGENEHE